MNRTYECEITHIPVYSFQRAQLPFCRKCSTGKPFAQLLAIKFGLSVEAFRGRIIEEITDGDVYRYRVTIPVDANAAAVGATTLVPALRSATVSRETQEGC